MIKYRIPYNRSQRHEHDKLTIHTAINGCGVLDQVVESLTQISFLLVSQYMPRPFKSIRPIWGALKFDILVPQSDRMLNVCPVPDFREGVPIVETLQWIFIVFGSPRPSQVGKRLCSFDQGFNIPIMGTFLESLSN